MTDETEAAVIRAREGGVMRDVYDHAQELEKRADCEREARQSRLDEFSKAALTGLIVQNETDFKWLASTAWDIAEAMESERARRMEK